ncbi:Gfo/Idh/MocA family oxidoreductase [Psychrosphaera sp. B3R10]|uniref:Gfo/Idh/MocA family protein n=1 Tax=unclassified Psychrosphaera TaxID=2641570 RepID=UPI001C0880FC|nr:MULTISPECIES: Gfo/Idh/MocA family oxidoreductase [unclassified Psychrosphaera]MBU2883960.1 Gfo/Idh/MocA family oxidoreductase [Psychrosphaera sp. I2R16]MBU2990365.1 Gfo/Idh/MocA family oxidoreductase [Psychrosphaera sp. B3R10]
MTNSKKLKWGILSTANIAKGKLIPAIHASNSSMVYGVASRNLAQAEKFAQETNIPNAFGSYQALLDDPSIDIIYNPLPNHLHVPWTIRAIEAGKHVLCEKPIGLDVAEVEQLIAVADKHPQLKIMEAFMYRFHPQWTLAKQLIEAGEIGTVHTIDAAFTFHNVDPENVRNMPNIGGGGMMDIGCYCISATRFLLGQEPKKVMGSLVMDTNFGVDKHANAILDFGDVKTSFFCSTQSESSQRVYIVGETGSLTIEYPFYQPDDCQAELTVRHDQVKTVHKVENCDQYVFQVDALVNAVNNKLATPTPLTDALANMKVIDGIFASDKKQNWVVL